MNIIEKLKDSVPYDSILATPISQELRYYRFVDFIKGITKRNKRLKILEISSGASGITKFAKVKVHGMDVNFPDKPSPYLVQIKRSALKKFPFKDNEFDVVLSVDGYEHLPRSKRSVTFNEMFRVSKKYILMTTLFGETRYDRRVLTQWTPSHKYYKDIYEHKKMGYPSLSEIRGLLKGKKHKIRMIKGVHPRLAYYLKLTEQGTLRSLFSRTFLRLFIPFFKRYVGTNRYYLFIEKLS